MGADLGTSWKRLLCTKLTRRRMGTRREARQGFAPSAGALSCPVGCVSSIIGLYDFDHLSFFFYSDSLGLFAEPQFFRLSWARDGIQLHRYNASLAT